MLGWEPKVAFDELIRMMVDADLERVARLTRPLNAGAIFPGFSAKTSRRAGPTACRIGPAAMLGLKMV